MNFYCRMSAAGSLQECFSQCDDCKTEVFYIGPDYDGPHLKEALFDGPGWYFWSMRAGDVEGPYENRQEAERAAIGWWRRHK